MDKVWQIITSTAHSFSKTELFRLFRFKKMLYSLAGKQSIEVSKHSPQPHIIFKRTVIRRLKLIL